MNKNRSRIPVLAIAMAALLAASMACNSGAAFSSPVPETPEAEATADVDPTAPTGANLVILDAALDTTTPAAGGWIITEVTVENQGGETASGYELVLIPHYGWGLPIQPL